MKVLKDITVKIIKNIKEGTLFRKILLRFLYPMEGYKIYYLKSIFDKIEPRKIVCVSFNGIYHSDNPAYVVDEMLKMEKDLDIVWLVDEKYLGLEGTHPGIRLVNIYSFQALYELSTAHIWIDNTRKNIYVPKKKNQFYLQTWHGGLMLKKVEADVADQLGKKYIKEARRDAKDTDLMLSNSTFTTEKYRSAFYYTGTVLEKGSPRNDMLIDVDNKKVETLKRKLQIPENVKVLLYAPTFRAAKESNPYIENFDKIIETFEKVKREKMVVLIKHHPNNRHMAEKLEFSECVRNMSEYPDIQDLYLISDYLITDYSSTMFEIALLNRPVFLYINDYKEYASQDRGFYFDFNELPFETAYDMDELLQKIQVFNEQTYEEKVADFFKKLGLVETGKAAQITAQYLLDVINK